jgi:hypothetical protein
MKMTRSAALRSVATALLILSGSSVRAERIPRIELLRAIHIDDARVLLSDLLPATAPASLRTIAAEISLGAAPQPGNTRILKGDAVERSIGANQDVLASVVIPVSMTVSRDARPITLTEVFTAVRLALKQSGAPAADTLRPDDIILGSQVFVSVGDSGLQVMRMEFDRGLRRARFLLWPSRDPKVVPFFVTASLGGELPMAPVRPSIESGQVTGPDRAPGPGIAARATTKTPPTEILVDRGERATLMMHSDTLRMFVDVVSLERGTLGQQIQVRTLDGGRILNAQVDGHAHLDVKF